MTIVVISIAAFLVAILTFFSGFGLGTLLTPVLMLFFPVELAIALTGVVHLCNNIFKLILVGNDANKEVLLRFGLPAVIAAVIGSWVLLNIPDAQPLFAYQMFEKTFEVFPVKFIISVLLIVFASMDLIPFFIKLQFGKDKLTIGGVLSGFFGGLSGHQGALRTAFLVKAGLSKEAFIATAVVVSTFVDLTRLSIYATGVATSGLTAHLDLVIAATFSGIAGAFLGHKLLKKVTFRSIQITIAVMLILMAIALGAGWL